LASVPRPRVFWGCGRDDRETALCPRSGARGTPSRGPGIVARLGTSIPRGDGVSASEVRLRELDELYDALNRREFVHPDPLEFLYCYDDPRDREVAGIIASALAYGNVRQILAGVERALAPLGPTPSRFVGAADPDDLMTMYAGFRYRFTSGEELASLLVGVRCLQRGGSTLGATFAGHLTSSDETVAPALGLFVRDLVAASPREPSSLIPRPERGSACKRLHLFLRWMVREDEVDPGGWRDVPPSKLVVPLDVHMHRFARALGLTRRATADLRTALEVTAAFRRLCPEDPVRYDFAITRLGIRRGVRGCPAAQALLRRTAWAPDSGSGNPSGGQEERE